MMPSVNDNLLAVTRVIATPLETCWRALVDGAQLTGWVPGLRRARVIAVEADGLPTEIVFEFSASLTYSLVYRYDRAAHEVHWEPRVGKRDGVRGFARLEACPEGTRLTYALEQGGGRSAADVALSDPDALVAAFAAWLERQSPAKRVGRPA